MSVKILASYDGSQTPAKVEIVKRTIADALGVRPEDVVILSGVTSLSIVEVPDAMVAARTKADAEAAKAAEAEKAAAEAAEVEKAKAAAPVKAAEAKVTVTEAAGDVDYDAWTLADLHAEASKRDVPGRSGMDKAALVKALKGKK